MIIPSWLLKKEILIAAGVAALVATIVGGVIVYGDMKYDAGYKDRQNIELKLREAAVNAAREEERRLAADRERRLAEAHARDLQRAQDLVQVETEIENAPDFETRYSAYISHRNSLRDARAERLARARADYLSTVTDTGDNGARTSEPELREPSVS